MNSISFKNLKFFTSSKPSSKKQKNSTPPSKKEKKLNFWQKLIQPEMKIEYIPKIGMNPSELTLKMVGEDDYEVEVKYL